MILFLVIPILFFVIPKKIGHVDKKTQKTKFKLKYIESLIDEYHFKKGNYPSSLKDLTIFLKKFKSAQSYNLEQLLIDPWGNKFNYLFPGIHNSETYDLWSYGADNLPSGKAGNKDITNWGKI
jgi:general secretion pathway protein G